MTIKKKINLLIIIFVIIIIGNAFSTFYGDNKVSSLNKKLQNESNIANQLNKIKYTIKSLQESSLKISLSSNPDDISKLASLRNIFIKEIQIIKKLKLDEDVQKSVRKIEKGFDELYEKLRNISVMGIHKETQKKLSNLKLQEFIETISQTKDTLINLYRFIIRNNVTKMQTQIATMESAYITVLASGNGDRIDTAEFMRKKMLRTLTRAMKRKPEGRVFLQKQIDNINKLSQIGNELAEFGIAFVEFSQLQEENIINTNLTVKNYFDSLDKLSKKVERNVSSIIVQNNDSLNNLLIIAIISTVFSIIFLCFLWIISKSIIYNITRLSKGVDTLMSYSSADQEIDIKSKDEIGHLARSFNTYMKSLRSTMIQDQKIVEEAEKAIQMAKSGFFVYTIKNSSTNRSTNDLKNAVNEMIHDLNEKFTTINKALMEYGSTNFDYNIDVKDASGTIGSIVSGTKAIGSNVSELLATIMISGEKLSENIDVLSNASNSLSDSANNQA
ncbi:MAG: methyl-accepting chemotaxis protein, partial [Campylobacteraceae bacterium]|nr:methyl-accepting chemotaxis protein [Campylobacteraceae bacterium]